MKNHKKFSLYVIQEEQSSLVLWSAVCNFKHLNPFQVSDAFDTETGHLFCTANQMTGFYVECNAGLKCVVRKVHGDLLQHQPISCNWYFLYPLKTSENQRFSYVFRAYRKKTMTWNELKIRFPQV